MPLPGGRVADTAPNGLQPRGLWCWLREVNRQGGPGAQTNMEAPLRGTPGAASGSLQPDVTGARGRQLQEVSFPHSPYEPPKLSNSQQQGGLKRRTRAGGSRPDRTLCRAAKGPSHPAAAEERDTSSVKGACTTPI